jgi:hypothetical protein
LLGGVGSRARAAGRVKHQVAGIGGHQNTALDHGILSLHDIYLVLFASGIEPNICYIRILVIIEESAIHSRDSLLEVQPPSLFKPTETRHSSLPMPTLAAVPDLTIQEGNLARKILGFFR